MGGKETGGLENGNCINVSSDGKDRIDDISHRDICSNARLSVKYLTSL